jgi:hypothetical protein
MREGAPIRVGFLLAPFRDLFRRARHGHVVAGSAVPPGIYVLLQIEEPVKLVVNCDGAGQEARLTDWFATHPAQRELLTHAVELATREQGAT